jgi:hypothetical protein
MEDSASIQNLTTNMRDLKVIRYSFSVFLFALFPLFHWMKSFSVVTSSFLTGTMISFLLKRNNESDISNFVI